MNNILKLIKIYFSFFTGKQKTSYFPLKIWIETTARCNLSCRLCGNRSMDPEEKNDMDMDLFKKIIDEITSYSPRVNLFHRGEPLLHPKISEMIKYCSENKLRTSIHTNAALLTEEISAKIIGAGLDNISFSLDGYNKKTYEKNRTGAVYEDTLENIKGFLRVKNRLKSKTPISAIQVMEFDEDKTSIEKKRSFIKEFYDLGLNNFNIRKPHNWGGSINLPDSEACQINNISRCTFPYYSLVILYDGRVTVCPQDFYGLLNVGDVSKNSLMEIFNSEKLQLIRKSFKNKDIKDLKPCISCDRIRRKTIAKIPVEYFSSFLKESFRKN